MEEKRVKYPIGLQDFAGLREDGYLYIDKTELVYNLVKSGKYLFLSRPRRFGKSLLLSTIKYYFEGRRDLFEGLGIMKLEKEWKKHPVFLFSFARFEKNIERSLELLIEFHLSQWEREYGLDAEGQTFENRFSALLKHSVELTGEKAVVLIDEYDSALVSTLNEPKLHSRMKSLLKPIYTVLKDYDMFIEFAFITGITRFSKLSIFSGLNNLYDLSLDKEFAGICGITERELEANFNIGIEKIRVENDLRLGETLPMLKAYYDGYHFTRDSEDIYNPFSILCVMKSGELRNYWFSTGIPTFLVERLQSQDVNLEKYMNPTANEETLKESDSAYMSDLALLFQTGFLTIKSYNPQGREYKLGIPNREVKEGMSKLFMEKFLYPNKFEANNILRELIEFLEIGEPERFMKLLKSFFAGVPFDLSKGDKEVYFQNSFYILANLIGLRVEAERHTSSGSIDLLITTREYIYIFEIKMNKKPEVALEQINSKAYALQWEEGKRKVFKIGVSFSSRTRNIGKWIIAS